METSSSCLNHLFCKFFFHLPCPSICHWGNTWYRKNILAWLNILLSGLCNSVVSSGEIQSKGLVKTNIYWYLFLRSFDNLIVQSANIIWQSIYQNYRGNVKKKCRLRNLNSMCFTSQRLWKLFALSDWNGTKQSQLLTVIKKWMHSNCREQ